MNTLVDSFLIRQIRKTASEIIFSLKCLPVEYLLANTREVKFWKDAVLRRVPNFERNYQWQNSIFSKEGTAWKVPKDRIFSGPFFPAFALNSVFSPSAGKYGSEKSLYFDNFLAVGDSSYFSDNVARFSEELLPRIVKRYATPKIR